ncbi:hypothetical protein E2C01_058112 [Portunus trituberculatus]|uniref:Uncharacterized protein n=1 Tax=Portunus trituberculatus TaxID=210409 RepID=A0A5B7GYR7_PORTR|nr:hypothetical protein [Portunus trituberculatus]
MFNGGHAEVVLMLTRQPQHKKSELPPTTHMLPVLLAAACNTSSTPLVHVVYPTHVPQQHPPSHPCPNTPLCIVPFPPCNISLPRPLLPSTPSSPSPVLPSPITPVLPTHRLQRSSSVQGVGKQTGSFIPPFLAFHSLPFPFLTPSSSLSSSSPCSSSSSSSSSSSVDPLVGIRLFPYSVKPPSASRRPRAAEVSSLTAQERNGKAENEERKNRSMNTNQEMNKTKNIR